MLRFVHQQPSAAECSHEVQGVVVRRGNRDEELQKRALSHHLRPIPAKRLCCGCGQLTRNHTLKSQLLQSELKVITGGSGCIASNGRCNLLAAPQGCAVALQPLLRLWLLCSSKQRLNAPPPRSVCGVGAWWLRRRQRFVEPVLDEFRVGELCLLGNPTFEDPHMRIRTFSIPFADSQHLQKASQLQLLPFAEQALHGELHLRAFDFRQGSDGGHITWLLDVHFRRQARLLGVNGFEDVKSVQYLPTAQQRRRRGRRHARHRRGGHGLPGASSGRACAAAAAVAGLGALEAGIRVGARSLLARQVRGGHVGSGRHLCQACKCTHDVTHGPIHLRDQQHLLKGQHITTTGLILPQHPENSADVILDIFARWGRRHQDSQTMQTEQQCTYQTSGRFDA
mmetsp:Transcript_64397/g.184997  ORF Transcript_64397/g.184997 Transcript_64397/m.184997 type:complete len:396 (+) Transcript_64397:990-2177(+)